MLVALFGFIVATGSCWVAYRLLVQIGRLSLRLENLEKELIKQGILPETRKIGLPVGSVLSEFSLPLLSGGTMQLSQWRGTEVLLIFVHPACDPSREMVEELSRLTAAGADPEVAPIFISAGTAEENRRFFEQFPLEYPVLLQEDREVAAMYLVHGTPMGYLVDEVGRTASELIVGADALLAKVQAPTSLSTPPKTEVSAQECGRRKFTGSLADSRILRNGLKAGTPAASFTLPQLNGMELSLQDYRGQMVLLVFSDPACAPCTRLAPKLERIQHQFPHLQVLVISRGDPEANRKKAKELGLTFPIVLQRHWEISKAYGMFATPIGYLVDANGILASGVAVGADAILKLAFKAEQQDERLAKADGGLVSQLGSSSN